VERYDFRAEEVLAGREVRDGDGDFALGGNELVGGLYAWLVSVGLALKVNATYPVIGISLAEDLGPDGTLAVGGSRSDVDLDGALVAGVDDIIVAGIVGPFKQRH
jgi:hypothetical protein